MEDGLDRLLTSAAYTHATLKGGQAKGLGGPHGHAAGEVGGVQNVAQGRHVGLWAVWGGGGGRQAGSMVAGTKVAPLQDDEAHRHALDVTISHVRGTVLARLGQHSAVGVLKLHGLRGGPAAGSRRVGVQQLHSPKGTGVQQPQSGMMTNESRALPSVSISHGSTKGALQQLCSAVAVASQAVASKAVSAPSRQRLSIRAFPPPAGLLPQGGTALVVQPQVMIQPCYSQQRARFVPQLDLGKLAGVLSPLNGKLLGELRSCYGKHVEDSAMGGADPASGYVCGGEGGF